MVWIPEASLWIGRTEVTWDEYLAFCGFGPGEPLPPGVDAVSRPSKPVVPFDRDWGFGRRPAVGMSWNAAKTYCRWLSRNTGRAYRLPAEAEWALACGPDREHAPIDEHAWHAGNSGGMTAEVAGKSPNRRGLFDMLGNLWEYCRDGYGPDEPERAVLRGGSWTDPPEALGARARLGFEDDWVLLDPNVPPGVWWVPDGSHLGFRVLRPGPAHLDGATDRE